MKNSLLIVGGVLSSSLMSSVLSSEFVQIAVYHLYSQSTPQHSVMANHDLSVDGVKVEFVSHLELCETYPVNSQNPGMCRN